MDISQAFEFVNSFINYERTDAWAYPAAFKLDRMRALAKELGNPQKSYESVLIAGSKGKGSTAAILSSILRMENLRVGLYTSPHLVDLRERIQVNGLMISESHFIETVLLLKRILESAEWRRNPPTYFEVLTAIAFWYFKEMKVQAAVLEVGLGGLYDSTDITEPKVVGLTPISLEHTDKLGKTLSKIAVQKCGIIKGRETVVSSPQTADADAVIQKAVRERDAKLLRVGKEIKVTERTFGEDFQRFDIRSAVGDYFDLELSLLGSHQMENAALAVGLAKSLEARTRMKLSDSAIRQGIADARWPGRLERVAQKPAVILDGAQNADSAWRLAAAVKKHFHYQKLILILGVSGDKDLEGILTALEPLGTELIVTQAGHPRAMPVALIADAAEKFFKRICIEKEPKNALGKALSMACEDDLILVTGSLFLIGDIKSGMRPW